MKKYLRYVYASLAVPLAILLRYALMPLIGHGVPYVTLFVVTGSVAVLGGLIPAVITAALGAIATDYFFIEPLYTLHFSITFISQMCVVVLTSAFIGYIGDQLRTARKKAESQALVLHESREDLYRAQSVGNIGSWRLDVNKNILTWSDENHRIFGIPKGEQMSYETFLGTIHPDDRDYVDAKWKAGLSGEDYDIEHRIIANGKVKWVREKAYLEFDSKGNLLGGFGISQDITEKKQSEEALLRAKREWERTFNSVSDMIAILDNKHNIVRVNNAMAKYIGKEPDECMGLPCYLSVHNSNKPPSFCPHSMTIKDKKEHIAEIREEKFGRDLLINTSPLFDEHDKIIGSVHLARDITESKKAAKALENSELRYRRLFEAAYDGILILDTNTGQIVDVNPFLINMLGYSREEFTGKKLWEIGLFKDIAASKDAFIELQNKGYVRYENLPLETKDGRRIAVEFVSNIYSVDHTKVIQCNIRDISKRMQAEESLQNERTFVSAVLDTAGALVVVLDRDGNIIRFNRACEKITGYFFDEIKGRCFWDFLLLPVEIEPVKKVFTKLRAGQFPMEFDNFWVAKDGTRRLIHWTNSCLTDSSGEVEFVIGTGIDFTERHRAEEALRQSEERLRLALNAANSGSWEWDLKTNENIWSDELWRLYGLEPNSCKPSYETWRQIIHPDDRLKTEQTVQEAASKGAVLDAEWRVRHKDGTEHWLMSRGQPIRDSERQVVRYIGIVIDITGRKKAEQELHEAKEKLEMRVQERTIELQKRAEQLARLTSELTLTEHRERQQLAQVLHDHLQQILVGAKIQVELLLRRVGKDEKHDVKHIMELLNESITASRSLTAELSPPIPRDAGLITGLEWLTRWMKEKYGLTVILETDEQYNVFRDDLKILLFQAVRELLINVMKHSKVLTARIELAQHDPENLRIAVSDNGIGFDHKTLLSDENRISGGFGLFSIRERLSTLGGRMDISSTPGEGSCFTLIVPIKNLQEMPVDSGHLKYTEYKKAQDRTAITASIPPIVGRKIKILLVDDHIVMRQGLSRLLKEETDLEVVGEASNGAEAIEKSTELQPDVILMDYNMPDIDGAKATRIIHAKAPHIRIIGLSMYQEPAQTAMMMDAGAVEYLAKSDKPESLLDAIRRSVNTES